jgi:hypothetical protein
MSIKNKQILKKIKEESDSAYESYVKARDHFQEVFEKALRKHDQNFEKRLEVACDYISQDFERYIDDIDILITAQMLLALEI